MGVGSLVFLNTTLYFAASDSLSGKKVFLTIKGLSYKRGDFVTAKHRTQHLGVESFTKEVAGIEGDKILIQGEEIFINDKKIGKLFTQFKGSSIALVPIKATVIPKGFVFLAGHHERSYDSRYENFGLVPVKEIEGRSFALL